MIAGKSSIQFLRTALCQNKITKCLMEEKSMDVLYTDFSKAFDKVSHKKLLHKMRAYGIVGKMWKWIEAFLSDRKQFVVMGDTESSMKKVISSVPQGLFWGTYCLQFLLMICQSALSTSVKCMRMITRLWQRMKCK